MNHSIVAEDAIFRVGTVVSVRGRTVEIAIDKTKNASHLLFRGQLLKNVGVGSYIKIIKGFTSIIGKIDGEAISEERHYGQKAYGSEPE